VRLLQDGKTKSVLEKDDGTLVLKFKDDVTGADGKIDPGANAVVGQVEGKGNASLRLSHYFFTRLQEEGIPSHFLAADPAENTMTVKRAELFGRGLEFICRLQAYGSFLRRYGAYAREFQELDYLVEITIKDDERGDPLINDDTILALEIMTAEQLETAKDLTRRLTRLVEEELAAKDLKLIDIKFEFGLVDGAVAVIDEISGDNMRVMDKEGKLLDQKELCGAFFGG